VSWNRVCKEKGKGGIGLRRMKHINFPLKAKMPQKITTKEEKNGLGSARLSTSITIIPSLEWKTCLMVLLFEMA